MTQEELKETLRLHALWLEDVDQGKKANLRSANLRDADLYDVDLRDADLSCANLRSANLRKANLRGADLHKANLRYADLWDADLSSADLWDADLRDADLRDADLYDADLSSVNLRDANLRDADLRKVNLRATIGNMEEVKSLQLEGYAVTYTAESLQIGCERHPINCWWDFCDETIAEMDTGALDWWRKWKEPLRQIIELSPATPPTEGD